MKRLALFLLILLGILSVADDLKTAPDQIEHSTAIIALQEHRVQPGENVLSIIEANHGSTMPSVPIARMLDDFSRHNNNMDPYGILTGRTYLFPIYETKDRSG